MTYIKKNKLMAGLLALVMALALIFAPIWGTTDDIYASEPVHVTVDGQLVLFQDQRPVMIQNRVMVPVRGVFERMGFTVTWDYNTRMARLERSDVLIIIPADLNSFVVGTTVVSPSVPQRIINNRLMLPLRYVAEAAGGTAEWDAANRVAIITSNQPTPTPSPAPATPSPTPAPTPTPTPSPTPSPTPYPDEPENTPTPPPEETPSPTPPPAALFTLRPFAQNQTHNITRSNANLQGTDRQGILTRVGPPNPNEQRTWDSWIEFDLHDLGYTRLTGYYGRVGRDYTVSNTSGRYITIYTDGEVIERFHVDGYTQVTSFEIDISGASRVRIHFQAIGPVEERGVSLTVFDLNVR